MGLRDISLDELEELYDRCGKLDRACRYLGPVEGPDEYVVFIRTFRASGNLRVPRCASVQVEAKCLHLNWALGDCEVSYARLQRLRRNHRLRLA